MQRWQPSARPLTNSIRGLSTATSYQPSAASLEHRARLACAISPLKSVRPHTPFWKLSAHRLPTLWKLYRGLLRLAPSEDVRFRVTKLFKRYQYLTSPTATKFRLEMGHRWLKKFQLAHDGDPHWKAVLTRYGRMIAMRREKEYWKHLFRNELAWQSRLANRPILTGAYMYPNIYHGPLPRMKPQPIHVTGMIVKRKRARVERIGRQRRLAKWRAHLVAEAKFENALASTSKVPFEPVFGGRHEKEWVELLDAQLGDIQQAFARDEARSRRPFPAPLLRQIRVARKEKVRNKLAEREREKRGEVTNLTRKRRNRGYPAAVMDMWNETKKREMLTVRRSVSEVGYVGMLKRKMGWKIGPPEDMLEGDAKERVENLEKMIARENRKRRTAWASQEAE